MYTLPSLHDCAEHHPGVQWLLQSTLVSSWLERSDFPYVWLALDAGDSALNVFVEYLLAAIERIVPGIRQRLNTQMQRTAALSYASMARLLADELDVVDESFVLVFDSAVTSGTQYN